MTTLETKKIFLVAEGDEVEEDDADGSNEPAEEDDTGSEEDDEENLEY